MYDSKVQSYHVPRKQTDTRRLGVVGELMSAEVRSSDLHIVDF